MRNKIREEKRTEWKENSPELDFNKIKEENDEEKNEDEKEKEVKTHEKNEPKRIDATSKEFAETTLIPTLPFSSAPIPQPNTPLTQMPSLSQTYLPSSTAPSQLSPSPQLADQSSIQSHLANPNLTSRLPSLSTLPINNMMEQVRLYFINYLNRIIRG
jgi:hypothetical protein